MSNIGAHVALVLLAICPMALASCPSAFAPHAPTLMLPPHIVAAVATPQRSMGIRRSGEGRLRMLEGTEVATAGFVIFNVAYVAQLLAKPRQRAEGDPFALLQSKEVYRASDGAPLSVTSQWNSEQKAVVVFMRSFG